MYREKKLRDNAITGKLSVGDKLLKHFFMELLIHAHLNNEFLIRNFFNRF